MKHLLIYMIAALLIFSYINFFVSPDDIVPDFFPTQLTMAAEAIAPTETRSVATPIQAGIIFNSMSSLETVYCKNAIIEHLGSSYNVHVNEVGGNQEIQQDIFDKMVGKGYRLIFIELFEESPIDYFISAAQKNNLTLVFMGKQPTAEQLNQMDNLYYIGYELDNIANTLAEASVMMWMTEREDLDYDDDDILEYSVISKAGFMETGYQAAFEEHLNKIGLSNEVVYDFLTDDITSDLENAVDKMIIDDSELFICVESSNAKRLVNYLNDPTEFKKWPKLRIAVLSVDNDARKLVEQGYVSVAVGYDGTQLGVKAAELAATVMMKEQPSGEELGLRQEERSFFVPPTTLRAEKKDASVQANNK
ncbi:MAG: hypothetical protein VB100_01185 [Angelakisella sp.]|nr:hypothetical protein [Angelakisella sp.]